MDEMEQIRKRLDELADIKKNRKLTPEEFLESHHLISRIGELVESSFKEGEVG